VLVLMKLHGSREAKNQVICPELLVTAYSIWHSNSAMHYASSLPLDRRNCSTILGSCA